MRKVSSLALSLAVLLSSGSLFAGPFKVGSYTCTGDTYLCSTFGSNIQEQLDTLEAEVNANLPSVDAKRYANGMANSLLLSTKGLSVDYGSNIKLFVVGGGLGMGIDPGDKGLDGFSDPTGISGIGASVSGMVGMNLGLLPLPEFGPIDPKKAVIFANFAAMDLPKVADELSGSFSTIGLHARYKFVDNWSFLKGLVEWSGVDITSGLNYSKMKVQLKFNFKETINENLDPNTTMVANYNATAILGPEIGVFNIPVEASTGVLFLYIFRLYGGLGLDFNTGYSDIKAQAPGNLQATITSTTPATSIVSAPTSLNLGGSSNPDVFGIRAFSGLQLDFAVMNIFFQFNNSFTAGTYGFSAGARAFF